MSLINKIREARKFSVKVGNITLHGYRPTVERFSQMTNKGLTAAEVARECVTSWEGVTEADLLPGGDDTKKVAFDKTLFSEVIGDMTNVWAPLSEQIVKKISEDIADRSENSKNFKRGSRLKS